MEDLSHVPFFTGKNNNPSADAGSSGQITDANPSSGLNSSGHAEDLSPEQNMSSSRQITDAESSTDMNSFAAAVWRNCEAVFRIDMQRETYQALKLVPPLSGFVAPAGSYRDLFRKLFYPYDQKTELSRKYEALVFDDVLRQEVFVQRILLKTDEEDYVRLFSCYPDSTSRIAYCTICPLPSSSHTAEYIKEKEYVLSSTYLYSMLVDLDDDQCIGSRVPEREDFDQYQLRFRFSEWRNMMLNSFLPKDRAFFLSQTDPIALREQLTRKGRISFDILMENLEGNHIWVCHSMTRVREFSEGHLRFVHTVLNIDKDKRELLQRIQILENRSAYDPAADDGIPEDDSQAGGTGTSRANAEKILDQIEQHIHHNYMQKMTLKDLSRKYFINTAYLGQLFIRRYQIPFSEYLCRERLSHAALALTTTDKLVYEIAGEVGYTNLNYFIRQFSEHYGCSPSRYRRQNTAK